MRGLGGVPSKFYYGWVIVTASFFVTLTAYGAVFSFGVFLKPIREDFGWTAAATSGAFSFNVIFYCLFGTLSGLAVDRLGPRITIFLGGLLMGLALILAGQTRAVWHIYLAYGLLGVGLSTTYSPLLTTTARWFMEKKGLALGIVTAGTGAGNLIIPPTASHLISLYGWRPAYLITGFLVGSVVIAASFFLRKEPGKREPDQEARIGKIRPAADERNLSANGFSFRNLLRNRMFWLISFIELMVGFGLQMILAQVVAYVQEGPKFPPLFAATILSTIGAASIAGRLIMGPFSDRIGRKRSIAICTSIEGLMILGLLNSSSATGLYLCAAAYGFGYGGHVPQFPAILGDLFGFSRLGTILGMEMIFYGIGGALGPFLAGHIFDISGNYTVAFSLASMAMFCAAGLSFALKQPNSGLST